MLVNIYPFSAFDFLVVRHVIFFEATNFFVPLFQWKSASFRRTRMAMFAENDMFFITPPLCCTVCFLRGFGCFLPVGRPTAR